jgi:hypothetical protein
MNRLPITEDKLTLILEFLKDNQEHSYTRRQIAQHLWDNYSYCDFKPFNKLIGEVSDKITKHVNKEGIYTQTVPLQITEYQTVPFTYQYKDVTENTVLGKLNPQPKTVVGKKKISSIEPQLSFEDFIDQMDTIPSPVQTSETFIQSSTEESFEESVLLEDVKACEKVMEIHNYKSSLIHWLTTSKDKQETLVEILKTIAEHA